MNFLKYQVLPSLSKRNYTQPSSLLHVHGLLSLCGSLASPTLKRNIDCVYFNATRPSCRKKRLLGTPNETVWPGVSKLMNWHEYPQWRPQSLSKAVPNLDIDGLYLLLEMLQYELGKHISAKKAMEHPYFDDLNKAGL